VQILRGLKSRFEEHHGVKYSSSALSTAAELAARFINDRHLPDKAIDVIDEAGAAQRILPKSKQKKTIGKTEIEDIVAKIARIPPQTVNQDDRSKLQTSTATCERGVRPGPGHRSAGLGHQDGACRPGQDRTSRSAPSCSPARPASARPRWPSSWPSSWHRADALRHVGIHGAPRRVA
jgi:hypothetical protein